MGRTESPNLKNDYERACGWYGHFNKSEMALFSECTDRYAQKLLDTAGIVREAIFQQSSTRSASASYNRQRLAAKKPHPDQREAKEDALVQPCQTPLAQRIEREERNDDWQRQKHRRSPN